LRSKAHAYSEQLAAATHAWILVPAGLQEQAYSRKNEAGVNDLDVAPSTNRWEDAFERDVDDDETGIRLVYCGQLGSHFRI
jgi:6-phosphogluconate dehydrogenase (decarboxylating)